MVKPVVGILGTRYMQLEGDWQSFASQLFLLQYVAIGSFPQDFDELDCVLSAQRNIY